MKRDAVFYPLSRLASEWRSPHLGMVPSGARYLDEGSRHAWMEVSVLFGGVLCVTVGGSIRYGLHDSYFFFLLFTGVSSRTSPFPER